MEAKSISRWTQSRCRRGYEEDKVMIKHATRIKYFETSSRGPGEKKKRKEKEEADLK